jgi:lipoprotein-anchoring transpeptidase ErfK/SrfK
MRKETRKYIFALALFVGIALGCQSAAENDQSIRNDEENGVMINQMQPTLEVSPTEKADEWLVAASDELKLTAQASGASEVKFNFSPIASGESDYYVEIARLEQANDAANGAFATEIKPPNDFAGELWVEAIYPDGSTRASEPVLIAGRETFGEIVRNNAENDAANNRQNDSASAGQNEENAAQSDESVYITANVPSFRLTLWENGRAAQTYEIGVGKRSHPIPIGDRKASQVILNPAWIPPDSPWVRRMRGVNPGERVTADDARNPLGNIKIPLGNAYLIHEAAAPSDIGSLVSHGCIRMKTDDIFDLTARLSGARGLSLSNEEIARARKNTERKSAAFDPPLPVRISYDTAIIENNQLHLYPDVYERGANTPEKLREFLQKNNLDSPQMNDDALNELWARVSMTEKFVVALDDFRAGRALEAGRKQPLTSESAKKEDSKKTK